MLEKAIIDSGVATGLDLGLQKPTTSEHDGASSRCQSFSTPASDGDAAQDLDFQTLSSWDFDPSPDSLDESIFFANQDFFENWDRFDLALDQEISPLPFMPDLNQQSSRSRSRSNASHLFILPWQEPSMSQVQSLALTLTGNEQGVESRNCEGVFDHSRKVSLGSKSARGQLKKNSAAKDGKEVSLIS